MRKLAYRDSLTGLPNRLLLEEHFKLIKAGAERNNKKLLIRIRFWIPQV